MKFRMKLQNKHNISNKVLITMKRACVDLNIPKVITIGLISPIKEKINHQ